MKYEAFPSRLRPIAGALVAAGICALPLSALADKSNPVCPVESVFYDPGKGEDVIVPKGYKIEVWAKDLNFPTDIAFAGNEHNFTAYVLESGTGLPSACNDNTKVPGAGVFSPNNPFTPDLLAFNRHGIKTAGPLGKPTAPDGGTGLQPDGPAIGLAFERGFAGGRLFVTDSQQGIRGAPGKQNNSSRISTINPKTGS